MPIWLLTYLLKPTTWLFIALAALGIYAAVLRLEHKHDLKVIDQLKVEKAVAIADAKACSDGVAELRREADAREKFVADALRKASEARMKAEHKADETLMAKPSNPNDMCASALELDRQKATERKR